MTIEASARTLFATCLLLLIAACGQSGPLYIPGNPSTIQTPPSAPAETEDEEDDETEAEAGP